MSSRVRSGLAVIALVGSLFASGCCMLDGAPDEGATYSGPVTSSPSQGEQPAPNAPDVDASNRARAAIHAHYIEDPIAYWTNDGLPALARGAAIREQDGVSDPDHVFASVMELFDPARFEEACSAELIVPAFCETARETSVVSALRIFTTRGDSDPTWRMLRASAFRQLLTTSFPDGALARLEPSEEKAVDPDSRPFGGNITCSASPAAPAAPAAEPSGPTWDNTGWNEDLAGGKNDGMCVTKAVGLCTHRLGMRNAEVTPEAWQKLSAEVGATPKGGAPIASIEKYFEANGYAFTPAYDGPFESACTEAMRALVRGCDVFLNYDWEGGAHIEMATDVDTSNQPGFQCLVTTNSWGHKATVKVKRGTATEKSDVDLYGGKMPETTHPTFYYACKKK